MKRLTTLLIAIVMIMNCKAQDNSKLYFGQEPPGLSPKLFAPGIICTDDQEGCSGYADNGNMFIYQRNDGTRHVYVIKFDGKEWGKPVIFSVLDNYKAGDFCVSPNGSKRYFASSIKKGKFKDGEGANIWFTELINDSWSDPKLIGSDINTLYHDSYPNVAPNGDLYFFSRRPGGFGKSDLYISKFKNGKYAPAENLGAILNTPEHEWDSYIAPDESYMIFCSMKSGGKGDDDLYVSFKSDGGWSEPISLGDEINSPKSENRPYVSPDSKYLFYTSNKTGNREIYWISIEYIKNLKK